MKHISPRLLLFPFTLALFAGLHAQTVEWMRQGGIGGQGRGISSVAAQCYVAGVVNDPALFDQDTTASHFADAFIAKYDESGTVQWVRTGGGSMVDQANDVVTDADGNAYVTGFFTTNGPNPTVEFDGTVVQGIGFSDLFLAKYNSAGTLQWLRFGGGAQSEEGRGVALTPDGNVVVSGFFQGTAVFGTDTLVSEGLSDILLLKYTADGDLLWSARAGGTGDDKANKPAACPNGDVAVVGGFQGTFALGANTISCTGLSNIFLARFAADGTALWSTRAGSTVSFIADEAFDIERATNGDLVFCGEIAGPADFDGLAAVPNGGIDLYIARYDGNGNGLWVHHAGGPQADHAFGVALDADGNSYLTGQADSGSNTVFDTITLAPFGNEAVFLAKYNVAGAVQWVKRYAPGSGRAVRVLDDGCLYFTGGASGIVGQPAFDNVPWQYVDRAIFTARFCGDISTAVADVPAMLAPSIALYPDPVSDVATLSGIAPASTIAVVDDQGRMVHTGPARTSLDVSAFAGGLYILHVQDARGGIARIRFMVAH